MAEVVAQDPEYQEAISMVENKKPHKEIESGKEIRKMGGEYGQMQTYQTLNGKLIMVGSLNPRIYMPKGYREKAIKDLHQSARKVVVVVATLRLHYTWPSIWADIRKVILPGL